MNKQAFTLIELLVVVLIIGILAAVALPQYNKAVEKSRAGQVLSPLKALSQSYNAYYLANGQAPTKIQDLDISLPWTGEYYYYAGANDNRARSNDDWSMALYHSANNLDGVCVVRIRGKYAGGGFCIFSRIPTSGAEAVLSVDQLYCIERTDGAITLAGSTGDYCKKLFGGTKKSSGNLVTFTL